MALLLVLAFLGHDLLMTSPKAVAQEHHQVAALHHADPHDAPLPTALSCDATREAATTSTPGMAARTTTLLFPLVLLTPHSAAPPAPVWQEPLRPPGGSRAFLQVYRL